MIIDRRLLRTVDGRIVEEGDPAGAFLAFTPGMEIADRQLKELGLAEIYGPKPKAKAVDKPEDKAVAAPANKAASPETPTTVPLPTAPDKPARIVTRGSGR